jgi:hypothetical protein
MKKSIMFLALATLALTAQNTFANGGGTIGIGADGGSTAVMLAAGIGGLVWCKNRFRR